MTPDSRETVEKLTPFTLRKGYQHIPADFEVVLLSEVVRVLTAQADKLATLRAENARLQNTLTAERMAGNR